VYGYQWGTNRFQSDFAGDNYALYGEITDIPEFQDLSDFTIMLYGELGGVGSNSNVMTGAPIAAKGFDSTEVQDAGPPVLYKGYWRFDYLPHDRRFGVLIHPPEGMQGHWLRWYTPESIILEP
jgi:hypothetical protein